MLSFRIHNLRNAIMSTVVISRYVVVERRLDLELNIAQLLLRFT